MRASKAYIATNKNTVGGTDLISHQLMLRSGLVKALASGIYNWMPLGLKVLRKVEMIVRQEMNNIGALELLMPNIQPAELWQQSTRWDMYGAELLRIKDRHQREFCFGPTHEEVIVDLVKKEELTYKKLPLCLYQIQTKFRDEIRPRYGVMRSREFIMKDAYSFHSNLADLEITYQQMKEAYVRILKRLGLDFRVVAADTGSIGGSSSHEFQVLASCGEDRIAYCENSDYAANIELAKALRPKLDVKPDQLTMQKVATPTQKSCEEVTNFLQVDLSKCVKSIVVDGISGQPVLLLIRADHQLNQIKLTKLPQIKSPLSFSHEEVIHQYFGCEPGYIGPVGFNGLVIADEDVINMHNFVCGANENGYHFTDVNLGRDCTMPTIIADIRDVVEGDIAPDGNPIKICRGIEVGHIFQLRTKYSEAMGLTYKDNNNQDQLVLMGCYGIGISRIVAAAIEQHHDDMGMVLPINLSVFEVVIVPIKYHNSLQIKELSDKLYQDLLSTGVDVLLDDRNERLGFMLADSELLGINYAIVIGERNLGNNQVELYNRQTKAKVLIDLENITQLIHEMVLNAKKIPL